VRLVPWLIGIAFAAYMIRQSSAVNRKLMKLFLITLRSTRPTEVAELTRGDRRSLKQV